ncbi:MAG: translation initiation factor IF-2 [Candidatus Yanofskybacteria bacterium RIFCSPHIGHO2_01_FULL_43_42]|uniref:Translation initiation factor IF-2 n=1 Tax=Candidatus Yanofskybacteria bacterium RIFCSPLOWO2_01_FULL_43_22 TaxID=1802695 RepID=A0A1F8GFQ3_9BACT|nr:MAG: translation initiation factor IF-2 [Candidatus Yanofskybacteria bacterium RIFCSPHIGHO2_01_FULL_43_42]OGN13030.1 MAG: translation initiation factor IF-2 [Candidatus Yanofskybacteria bacterium RIFCSPHIGHO2_02_FULL_43_17]OGN23890.1 MAG: translation initiation factor IF-2 [Candidatus Yanofskybacteria bacterium RIFCSPLOWO2_01_FULL_43_22]
MTDNNEGQLREGPRSPVVVVLGHVDHGKTKLLDTIRKTNIAEKESGGITQHIGAYQVEVGTGDPEQQQAVYGAGKRQETRKITFLDTPGHEAFTAIRSRGAKVADVAVLVVAADESVKPQTKEAIKIIKGENMPFVVAINKIDKEGANVQKVKQDLATEDVLVEDWGGKVPVVEISAKSGKNISELMDMILLVAELEEFKEDLSKPAGGVIIESHLDKRQGHIVTVLVQKGILSLGDWMVTGKVVGKIKSMKDFRGDAVSEARPSQPVMLTGWSEVPDTGVRFIAAYSRSEADEIADSNKGIDLAPLFSFLSETTDPDSSFAESFGEQKKKTYNLILKADVKSSLEAIDSSLRAIKSEDIRCNIVGYDVGDITENDVKTAIATKADIIGFRVGVGQSVGQLAEKEGIWVQTFDVIYELIETIRKNMAGLLEPEISKVQLGKLKVLALFKKNAKSQIFGGRVLSGKTIRGAMGEVTRNEAKVSVGKIGQLQHNKEDVSEVKEGLEAGIRLDIISGQPFEEVKEGDMVEIYEEEKTQRSL